MQTSMIPLCGISYNRKYAPRRFYCHESVERIISRVTRSGISYILKVPIAAFLLNYIFPYLSVIIKRIKSLFYQLLANGCDFMY